MGSVFVFGAGASCEYRGAFGPLFIDSTFFSALEEAREWWLDRAEPPPLAWRVNSHVASGGPHHYDGKRWLWDHFEKALINACGTDYESLGLEQSFSRVAAMGEPGLSLYLRAIELAMFHKIRSTEDSALDVHLLYLRRQLNPGDTIITFNYDPLIEYTLQALTRERKLFWHPQDGYGLEFRSSSEVPNDIRMPTSEVDLLKLHGSINWLSPRGAPPSAPFYLLRVSSDGFRGPGYRIKREDDRILQPVIVPPSAEKDIEAMGLGPIWTLARDALLRSTSLTIVGYRLPAHDQHARALFAETAELLSSQIPVKFVTLGDDEAISRIKEIFPWVDVYDSGFRNFAGSDSARANT